MQAARKSVLPYPLAGSLSTGPVYFLTAEDGQTEGILRKGILHYIIIIYDICVSGTYPVDRRRTEAPPVAPSFAGQLFLHCHLLAFKQDIQYFSKYKIEKVQC